ncbi:MAG: hypothetical protein ACE5LB_04780, partial [Acidiferrobacterales bacterium]
VSPHFSNAPKRRKRMHLNYEVRCNRTLATVSPRKHGPAQHSDVTIECVASETIDTDRCAQLVAVGRGWNCVRG